MNVTIYTTATCPRCKVLKEKLKEKDILFKECDDVEKLISKGFLSAPVLEVDNKMMNFGEAIKWVKEM